MHTHPPLSTRTTGEGSLHQPSAAEVDLVRTAADWFNRRQADDWNNQQEREFQSWLQADEKHMRAYDRLSHTWMALAQARPQASQAQAKEPESFSATAPQSPSRRRIGIGLGYAMALGTVGVVSSGAWWIYQNSASYQEEFATSATQHKELKLPDGTQITLNSQSHLSARYYGNRREIKLLAGEAFFDVARDPSRPFTVEHDSTKVRVLGTSFNVDASSASMTVKVRSGRVEVTARGTDTNAPRILGPGQAIYIPAQPGEIVDFDVPADAVANWRTGQLVFRNAPLSQVADELSRYLSNPIIVSSPELGQLRISGYANTSSPTAFVQALPSMVDVQIDRTANGNLRIYQSRSAHE